MEGVKFDTGKLRMSLLAERFVWGIVEVLEFGAKKYGEDNWRKGMKWSRPFNAAMRHMWAWWRGENVDPETGLSHLSHAACNLQFLDEYQRTGTGEDDRPGKDGAAFILYQSVWTMYPERTHVGVPFDESMGWAYYRSKPTSGHYHERFVKAEDVLRTDDHFTWVKRGAKLAKTPAELR